MTTSHAILYQHNPVEALLAGAYDGDITVRDLLAHGDFGLGAPDGLDGELLALDGQVFRVRADGSVTEYSPSEATPCAFVTFFHPTKSWTFADRLNARQLTERLDKDLPTNQPIAIKVTGLFASVRSRAPHAPTKPYPKLADVLKTQAEFTSEDVRGVFVGFRLPGYVRGVNIPGYHFHFLRDDQSGGGHVLDYAVADVKVEAATLDGLELHVGPAIDTVPLGTVQESDLRAAEGAR